jgi:hypothetical protein
MPNAYHASKYLAIGWLSSLAGSESRLNVVGHSALIPLAMLVFGFGYGMEIALVGLATTWPIFLLVRSAVRDRYAPSFRVSHFGFRLARTYP